MFVSFSVRDCCWRGRLLGVPGGYSVRVRVAGQEAGKEVVVVVSAATSPLERKMRRKVVVTRLIHCRVAIIVLRSCEVSPSILYSASSFLLCLGRGCRSYVEVGRGLRYDTA